jgi:phenylacetate-coenzyme A ligase PaaK-like adenylate-forming protein
MSDLVAVEFLRNGEQVSSGAAGHLVLTKLYGGGTPIIRYTAINDIVAPLEGTCSCGMAGGLLKKVYGRDDLALYLPGGNVLLASSFSEIYSRILYELKTNKVKNTKIIQHDLTRIEVQVVIDEQLRAVGPSVEEVCSFIKKGFQRKVGPEVTVDVHEVEGVDPKGPRIVSRVDTTKFAISEYL